MKTNRIRVLLVTLFSLPVMAFTNGDIVILEEGTPAKMEKIKIEIPKYVDLSVSIFDPEGRVIHSDVLTPKSSSARIYNLEQLESGKYTIITSAAHQRIVKEVEVKEDGINVVKKDVEFSPIFKQKGDNLMINFLNINQENVKVSVENNERVYYEKKYKSGSEHISFSKILDTSSLLRGSYYVNLDIGDEQHTFYFDKL